MSKKKSNENKNKQTKIKEKMHQFLWRQEPSHKDRHRYLSVLFCRESIP